MSDFLVDRLTLGQLMALSFLCGYERTHEKVLTQLDIEVLNEWRRYSEWFRQRTANMPEALSRDLIIADLEAVERLDPFSQEEMTALQQRFANFIQDLTAQLAQ